MATVGYLEGTDPVVLSRLSARRVGTLPLSNGFDNHGKFIGSVTERDEIDLIVSPLHKVMRTQRQGFYPQDLLGSCIDCQIPILIIVPSQDHMAAHEVLGQASEIMTLVDPAQLYDRVVALLNLA
jgi:hypothetical protein